MQKGFVIEFKQDNESVHTAKLTKDWFRFRFTPVMEWPARSPDLNPVENLWGLMARRVYSDRMQYRTIASLKDAILKTWSVISIEYMQNLLRSMPERCISVLQLHGGKTKY